MKDDYFILTWSVIYLSYLMQLQNHCNSNTKPPWLQWRCQHNFFFGGGEQEIFQWGQDPQKVISFDHFVPENVHFSWFHSNVGGQTGGRGQDIFWGGYLPPCPALPWCQHCMACIYETGTSGWNVRIPGLKSGQDMISWLFFVFNFFYLFIHSSLPGHRQLIMWWFINIWSIATLKMDVITGCK